MIVWCVLFWPRLVRLKWWAHAAQFIFLGTKWTDIFTWKTKWYMLMCSYYFLGMNNPNEIKNFCFGYIFFLFHPQCSFLCSGELLKMHVSGCVRECVADGDIRFVSVSDLWIHGSSDVGSGLGAFHWTINHRRTVLLWLTTWTKYVEPIMRVYRGSEQYSHTGGAQFIRIQTIQTVRGLSYGSDPFTIRL